MLLDKWLVVSSRKGRHSWSGVTPSVKLVEREPTLSGNEVAIRVKVQIPDAFFKRPKLIAELAIPDTAVPKVEITTEVTDNVEKIIKETTNLEMRVSIVPYKDAVVEGDE